MHHKQPSGERVSGRQRRSKQVFHVRVRVESIAERDGRVELHRVDVLGVRVHRTNKFRFQPVSEQNFHHVDEHRLGVAKHPDSIPRRDERKRVLVRFVHHVSVEEHRHVRRVHVHDEIVHFVPGRVQVSRQIDGHELSPHIRRVSERQIGFVPSHVPFVGVVRRVASDHVPLDGLVRSLHTHGERGLLIRIARHIVFIRDVLWRKMRHAK